MRWDLPSPVNAVDHIYFDFTVDKVQQGLLIVGQVTSFEDFTGVTTAATAKSGFVMGLDGANSCVIFDENWAGVTEEVGYTSISLNSISQLGSGAHRIVADSSLLWDYSDLTLVDPTHFDDAITDFNTAYTEV